MHDDHQLHPPRSDRSFGIGVGILALVAFAIRAVPGPLPVDDAYITFRSARNLLEGHGLTFNPGEMLLSTTTPLFALILAAVSGITRIPLPWAAVLVSGAAAALATWLLARVVRELTGQAALGLAAAGLAAAVPIDVAYAQAGMETTVFGAAVLAGTAAFLFRRDGWTALILAALPFIRPEGAVVSGALALGLLLRHRLGCWRYALPGLAAVILWCAVTYPVYGSVLPHSVTAKAEFFEAEAWAVGPLGFLRQWAYHFYSLFAADPIHFPAIRNTRAITILAGAAPFALGWIALAAHGLRHRPAALPLAAAPVLLAGAFILGGAGLPFPWYFAGSSFAFIAAAAAGFGRACRAIPIAALRGRLGPALLLIGMLRHLLIGYTPEGRIRDLDVHIPPHREAAYLQAGAFIAGQATDPEALVFCAEVGAIGWTCPLRVWDGQLTTPAEISRLGGAQIIRRHRPEFLTFMGLYPLAPGLEDLPPRWTAPGEDGPSYDKVWSVNLNAAEGHPPRHTVVVYRRRPENAP